jgi:hypothetical protein
MWLGRKGWQRQQQQHGYGCSCCFGDRVEVRAAAAALPCWSAERLIAAAAAAAAWLVHATAALLNDQGAAVLVPACLVFKHANSQPILLLLPVSSCRLQFWITVNELWCAAPPVPTCLIFILQTHTAMFTHQCLLLLIAVLDHGERAVVCSSVGPRQWRPARPGTHRGPRS